MAYCSKCGTQLSEGTNFCPKCGTPTNETTIHTEDVESDVKKNNATHKVRYVVSIILLFAILGAGWYIWKNHGDDYSLEGLAKAVVNYDDVGSFHCGRAHVIKYIQKSDNLEWKYGYIDKMGNEVIPCIYDGDELRDYEFHEGLAAVFKDGKYSYIDVDGKQISSVLYESAGRFSEGYAVASRDEKNYIIDSSGKELVEVKYSPIMDKHFSEGLFPVWGDEDRYGFINTKGELVIPCKYMCTDEGTGFFTEGLAVVYDGEKYGYIDKTGKEVIPFIYDLACPFSEGLACVTKDDEWFFIDKTGQKVIKINTLSAFYNGLAVECSEDGEKYYYIDKTGKNAFGVKFDSAESFIDGYARVGKKVGGEYLYGFIDKTGKEVILCKYQNLYSLSEGLALICNDDTYGFIDLNGKSTFDVQDEGVKQLVQQKINEKKKKKREEEEREKKRIEEENNPSNRFSSLAKNDYVWITRHPRKTEVLYFYPANNSEGLVSSVMFPPNDFNSYFSGYSAISNYKIMNNTIVFTMSGVAGLSRDEPWSEQYVMDIENENGNIRLVNHEKSGKNVCFEQRIKPLEDPIKRK